MCKSHEPSLEIPVELLIEILMRLPVKSLMRFKSVSKLWLSLICSKYFTDPFLKVSSSSPLHIYMWFGFGNCPLKKVLLSASSSLDSELFDHDFTISAMEGYKVSHVYRGLMCLDNGLSVQIYNTTTRQLVVLPDIEFTAEDFKTKEIMYHIGQDPVHNQYKVVCTVSEPYVMTEICVLQLGGDSCNRWRKISKPFQPHHPLRLGVSINGRIYYIAWDRLFKLVLVSFDICSEEISILQEPEYLAFSRYFNDVIEYGGREALLGYGILGYKGVMKLLVMEDAEKQSWSRKTLVLHSSQRHIINGLNLRVHGTTRNGEFILVPQMGTIIVNSQSNVFLYNLQNNLLKRVVIKETSKRHLTKIWNNIGFDDVENLMHL